MPIQGFDYPDLGGGVNVGQAPAQIENREFQLLINFYPYGTFQRRRGGHRLLTSSTWSGKLISGVFPLKLNTGDWLTIAAGRDEFAYVDGTGAFVPLVHASGVSLSNVANPWILFQYMGFGYALRRSDTRLYRFSRDTIYTAGIEAPTTGPTLADGGAGALTAATYRGVYTNYNMETNYESNPSPASTGLALGAGKKLDWSGITVSTNPFVTARRLYRTLPDQINEYFFVAQINNNVDTTFVGDNIAVADLGRTVSFFNGMPPTGLTCGVIWNEMLFAGDGVDLYFSESLMPEMFSGDFISIYPDDGHEIRGLAAFGDRLIIGKTNKMYYLVGTSRANFAVHTLSDAHGCLSHHSMQIAEGVMYWFGSGKRVYKTDGTSVRDISTPRIADYLDAVDDADAEYVVGAVYPELDWYVLHLPTGVTLIYNYRNDAWTTFQTSGTTPVCFGDSYNAASEHSLVYGGYDAGGTDSVILQFADPTYDHDDHWVGGAVDPVDITAQLTTKSDDFGFPGFRKYYDEIWMLTPGGSGTVTLIARGESGNVITSRSVSLADPTSDWKNYRLGTSRSPSSVLSLSLNYTGHTAIELQQLHFQVGVLGRKVGQPR